MKLFNKNFWAKESIAGWIIIFFLFGSLVFGVFFANKKEARALNATLPQQIISWIEDIVNWAADYEMQETQEDELETIEDIQEWFKDDTLERRSMRESWNQTRKDLLDELVEDILEWAQQGADGEPTFVTDWESYLGGLTEEAGQEFVDNLSNVDTCSTAGGEPFSQVVQRILNRNTTFEEQVSCIDDSEGCGWSDWLSSLLPSGNLAGVFLLSSDELMYEMGQTYEAEKAKLIANQGFRGDEETPGIVQSYATQRATMMDLDYLLLSDDLEEYFSSVVDAFINRIISEGLENLQLGSSYAPQGEPPIIIIPEEEEETNYVLAGYDYFISIADRLQVLLENLQALLVQQGQNLSVMNEIAAVQQEITSNGCSPATALIDPEISALTSEINYTQTKINQTIQAIAANNAAISAAESVIEANSSGDQASLEAALANFEAANNAAVSAFNALLENQESDIREIRDDINNYNLQVVADTNDYFQELGNERSFTGLEGRLFEENFQLLFCP